MTAAYPRVLAALSTPGLNHGVGFSREQRRELGLTDRLPSGVLTLEQQAQRVWWQPHLPGTPRAILNTMWVPEYQTGEEI